MKKKTRAAVSGTAKRRKTAATGRKAAPRGVRKPESRSPAAAGDPKSAIRRLKTREIIIDVYAYSLAQGAIPGTYQVGNSLGSSPTFATFFASGLGELQNRPSGTVTLTRVDSCASEGSFDISTQMADGGSLTLSGTFLAPFCAVQ